MTSRSDSESQSSDSDDMPLKFSCTKQTEKCETNSLNKSINSRVPNTRSSSQSEKAVASTKPNSRRVEINATIDPVKWAVENIFKPDSLLLENNILQELVSEEIWTLLPPACQHYLLRHLPPCDVREDPSTGALRLAPGALSHAYIRSDLREFTAELILGAYSHVSPTGLGTGSIQDTAEELNLDQWKMKYFEEYVGQLSGRQETLGSEEMEARAEVESFLSQHFPPPTATPPPVQSTESSLPSAVAPTPAAVPAPGPAPPRLPPSTVTHSLSQPAPSTITSTRTPRSPTGTSSASSKASQSQPTSQSQSLSHAELRKARHSSLSLSNPPALASALAAAEAASSSASSSGKQNHSQALLGAQLQVPLEPTRFFSTSQAPAVLVAPSRFLASSSSSSSSTAAGPSSEVKLVPQNSSLSGAHGSSGSNPTANPNSGATAIPNATPVTGRNTRKRDARVLNARPESSSSTPGIFSSVTSIRATASTTKASTAATATATVTGSSSAPPVAKAALSRGRAMVMAALLAPDKPRTTKTKEMLLHRLAQRRLERSALSSPSPVGSDVLAVSSASSSPAKEGPSPTPTPTPTPTTVPTPATPSPTTESDVIWINWSESSSAGASPQPISLLLPNSLPAPVPLPVSVSASTGVAAGLPLPPPLATVAPSAFASSSGYNSSSQQCAASSSCGLLSGAGVLSTAGLPSVALTASAQLHQTQATSSVPTPRRVIVIPNKFVPTATEQSS